MHVEMRSENCGKLTAIDDFSKEIFPPLKVFGGTVPAAVAKLILALGNGHVGTSRDGHEDPGIFPSESTLFSSESAVDGGVHRHGARRHGQKIVRLAGFCDTPGTNKFLCFLPSCTFLLAKMIMQKYGMLTNSFRTLY